MQGEITKRVAVHLLRNGLPVFTFELKNNITKQTVDVLFAGAHRLETGVLLIG